MINIIKSVLTVIGSLAVADIMIMIIHGSEALVPFEVKIFIVIAVAVSVTIMFKSKWVKLDD